MAARSFMVGHRAAMAAVALSSTTVLMMPKTTLYAEAPSSDTQIDRKPIYDDSPFTHAHTHIQASLPFPSSTASSKQPQFQPSTPRPTERLAKQIGRARIFLHRHVVASEDWLNGALARGLDLESSFTGTIASLAPDPATGERVLPGALYVVVAAMAGSILVRRRNIALRAVTPLALGIGAGWVLLPHTMRNVSTLTWRYEEKVPFIAMNHMRIRGAVEQGWREARERSRRVEGWSEERFGEAREAVEGWVRKGR